MDDLIEVPRTRARGLPPALARVPFGILRPVDGGAVYAHPRPEFRRLGEVGVLHRVATGYYAVVPMAAHDLPWLPSLEGVAFGIGAADYGVDPVALMGLSAARLHGVVPRALGIAVVAVPKQRPPVRLVDRAAGVVFSRRDVGRLDVDSVRTDLGRALVTTIEQTVLDLAHRPELGGVPEEARVAVTALWPRADLQVMAHLAENQRLRRAMARASEWAGVA